jgi:hypothetical protein
MKVRNLVRTFVEECTLGIAINAKHAPIAHHAELLTRTRYYVRRTARKARMLFDLTDQGGIVQKHVRQLAPTEIWVAQYLQSRGLKCFHNNNPYVSYVSISISR